MPIPDMDVPRILWILASGVFALCPFDGDSVWNSLGKAKCSWVYDNGILRHGVLPLYLSWGVSPDNCVQQWPSRNHRVQNFGYDANL